ncbi:3-oxoacyl-ACP synthase [Pedobacter antarcticus]|uniref:3-oxoacyl-ACP synthase n=1 Tax=Pedobacter antarcticus TaxID=34086 RepID=UPI00292CFC1F|nr:3-oxoacyl-ACP synthase [Pedobacter antarcticus]
MEDLKTALYRACLDFIHQRIQTAETALEQAREASNDDTKSSAGDKFETTREMMQQDISRNKSLLADAQQNLQMLESLHDVPVSPQVKNGSLVYTDNGIFYISISAGLIKLDDFQAFAISAVSPIGQLLLGKKEGDDFSFNQNHYLIKKIS